MGVINVVDLDFGYKRVNLEMELIVFGIVKNCLVLIRGYYDLMKEIVDIVSNQIIRRIVIIVLIEI